MCPGLLMYSLPPSLNKAVQIDKYNWSQPEEAASYGNFLISNPSTPSVKAIRINGKIAASAIAFSPIDAEFKGFQVTDTATGLKRVNDFNFRFLNGSQTAADPLFVRGGNGQLIYQNQTTVIVDSALRAIYGGRGSSLSAIMSNAVTSTLNPSTTIYGAGNVPVSVSFPLRSNSGILGTIQDVTTDLVLPSGYQYQFDCATFADAPSIQVNNARRGSFVFGTRTETFLGTGMTNPAITVKNGGVGLAEVGQPGSGALVPYTGTASTIVSSTVKVAAPRGQTREITIASQPGPFYSNSGFIYNSANTVVGICTTTEVVCGWAGRMFTIGSQVNNTQSLPIGSSLDQTDLNSIFTDLLENSKISYEFAPGFNETLLGYMTNRNDYKTDLSNLMSIFRKIVYKKRSGNLVFAPYPTAAPTLEIKREHHMSPPEITMLGADQISDAVNFSYRDIERQFDSSTVKIGGDSSKALEFNLEITAGSKDAFVYAQNLRNYQLTQTISGTLHLHPICNTIEPGDTLILKNLTGASDLPIIILRAETGADATVRFDFINWSPFIPVDPNLISQVFAGTPATARNAKRAAVDTEARSSRVGITYYTESSAQLLFAGAQVFPIVTNLSGIVTAITATSATLVTTGQIPTVNNEYYLFNTTTGEGSWVKISSVSLISTDTYNVTFQSGLYASNVFTTITPDLAIVELSELATADDNYSGDSFTQSGGTYTWSFNTQKRLREPRLAWIVASNNIVSFNRQSSLLVDDLDLGDSVNLPLVYFKVTSPSETLIISTNQAVTNTQISFAPGDIIIITQVNSSGSPLTGAVINTYTAP